MNDIRTNLISKITTIHSPEIRKKLNIFASLLYSNSSDAKNKVLMFGLDDKTIIKEMLGGSNGEGVIKDDAPYFIRISKTNKADRIMVIFNDDASAMNDDQKDELRELFNTYDSSVDINLALQNNITKHLTIAGKDNVETFLQNPDTGFRLLSASNFVKVVDVFVSNINKNGLHKTIDEVFIITYANKLLQDCKADESKVAEILFWREFDRNSIANALSFNFVILNNIDDWLMKTFIELRELYAKFLNIGSQDDLLLNRIFLTSKGKNYYKTKYKDKLPSNMLTDINDVDNMQMDVALDICFLCYIDTIYSNKKTAIDYLGIKELLLALWNRIKAMSFMEAIVIINKIRVIQKKELLIVNRQDHEAAINEEHNIRDIKKVLFEHAKLTCCSVL